MDLTRRQVAGIAAALYSAGGLLLLFDFFGHASEYGAHIPMAWHVYPLALAVQAAAHVAAASGPLDADWPVSAPIVIASFVTSACLCAAALFWLISRHEKTGAEESGK
jgi:hypothetical protein